MLLFALGAAHGAIEVIAAVALALAWAACGWFAIRWSKRPTPSHLRWSREE
jgi:hypothetical protein